MTAAAVPDPDLRDGSAATQSKNALGLGEGLGLLIRRPPVEVRSPESIARLRAELGEDAVVPTDDTLYYWVYVPLAKPETDPATGKRKTHQAILIPEGDVRGFCLGVAATAGLAHRFVYRDGVVPDAPR